MIKRKKRKNPEVQYSIEELRKIKNYVLLENTIRDAISLISTWTNGRWMRYNEIKKSDLDKFLQLRLALQPYISKEKIKIYRSIPLKKAEFGYYCSLNVENSYFQTAIKPLQNWTYSKKFAKNWGSSSGDYINIVFETNLLKNYDAVVFEPEAVLKYFSKIAKFFPEIYIKYRKEIDFQIYYLRDGAEELLLYSPDGDLFVEKLYVFGC